ncbi:MAG: DNA mismatch repair protein MutS [Christensenellaceae bacterium]|jgi:DNA mismatch repair protein MutS|nr:DNA mismatch repair protein MutS [Christensenellaceae bacterium]
MALAPMMTRYMQLKAQYEDCILFYRLGDFYEMFFEDAKVVSKALNLTLTGRDCGLEERAPMCGVPFHSANVYIKKLVDQGFNVAIAEQLTEAGKGLIERDVVKIITAGTVTLDTMLDSNENNFIAAVCEGALAWCDITTGELFCELVEKDNFADVFASVRPKEVLFTEELYAKFKDANLGFSTNHRYDFAFNKRTALETIKRYFNIQTTKVFDFEENSPVVSAAGALLEYITATQKMQLANISKIELVRRGEFMTLDKTAVENLEIVANYRDKSNRNGSLLWVLDKTQTAMGARRLISWLLHPLQNEAQIKLRQGGVREFFENALFRDETILSLKEIADLNRLAGKIASKSIMPREMISLMNSINSVNKLKEDFKPESEILKTLGGKIVALDDYANLISFAINDDAPTMLNEGGFIKKGYNEKLDELRDISHLGRGLLTKMEQTEREKTGIEKLKLSFNRVSGYYFEIPLAQASKLSYDYIRKGSTLTTEKFTTAELKELEKKILGSSEQAVALEHKLLNELRETLLKIVNDLQNNASAIANIDALLSFAIVASDNGWVCPELGAELILKNAKHAVLDKVLGFGKFIANDANFSADARTMIITGPNMAGKSTYMKTVALCVILAHLGSFVPATEMQTPIVDRVFTRIGASDDMLTGQSTFMVEMNEVSNILHNATEKSLLLLDEIGRGTGTIDGLSLARAILEYVNNKIKAKTMFATHFHELADIFEGQDGINNLKVLCKEIDGQIVFLHKVMKGKENNSFGIDVAKLSGVPQVVINNAKKFMREDNKPATRIIQPTLFDIAAPPNPSKIEEEIKNLDLDNLTPIAAFNKLAELQAELKKEEE